ncbi:MAG: 8-amino-7-oxononanoate synthase [Pseudomonadota bacterium]|nr:8-amino-7-oxononanoate synthase [Pseudomonadota bacterium]
MAVESLDQFAIEKLSYLAERGLQRAVIDSHRTDAVHIQRNGRALISFCCNDYLGLTHHPAVKRAAVNAISKYGTGAGASRLITGNHELYSELEAKLAAFKGTESACVFGSGYLANVGILPTLTGPGDLIVIDELGHASMHMGARASKANVEIFQHNDSDNLYQILKSRRVSMQRCLVVTEGIFSMDGDRAPLDRIAEVCGEHDAWLMVDDAHGFGVLGRGGGSKFEFDPIPNIPLEMGTLSKAAGGYGAFLCASTAVTDLMKNRARSLIYTTGLPPAVLAGAIAAISIIEKDRARVERPLQLAQDFCAKIGLKQPQSPIVPLIVGGGVEALDVSAALENAGFLVTPIRPPTVPVGTSRLRFTFTAEHTADQVMALADAVGCLVSTSAAKPQAAEV